MRKRAKARVRIIGAIRKEECGAIEVSVQCGCCVIRVAGGLEKYIPVVSVICGLINIYCVGSAALPVSPTCCPLSQVRKRTCQYVLEWVAKRCTVDVCGCEEGTSNMLLSICDNKS